MQQQNMFSSSKLSSLYRFNEFIPFLVIVLAFLLPPLGWGIAVHLEQNSSKISHSNTLLRWAKYVGMFLTVLYVGMVAYFLIFGR